MVNFLKSFFIGKAEETENDKAKNEKKNFEILKYDGIRAQRMGKLVYAIKCFTEALAIQKEFETLNYLATTYIQNNQLAEAREAFKQMTELKEADAITYLSLANVCYMEEDYQAMKDSCRKAIELENENATAFYMLAKADRGLKNDIEAIANLTKAIVLREDYTEAYLLRAEVLKEMRQYKEALSDVENVLKQNSEEEAALLLRGKMKEDMDAAEEAMKDYIRVTEINPFNEQAYLCLGQLLISEKKFDQAISHFDEAIEINPEFAKAYHERGRAKLLNGDKEGSIEDMKKALELNPKAEDEINGQYDNFDNLYANQPL